MKSQASETVGPTLAGTHEITSSSRAAEMAHGSCARARQGIDPKDLPRKGLGKEIPTQRTGIGPARAVAREQRRPPHHSLHGGQGKLCIPEFLAEPAESSGAQGPTFRMGQPRKRIWRDIRG